MEVQGIGSESTGSYRHRQRAPLHWLLHGIAIVLFVAAWQARSEWTVCLILVHSAGITAVIGFAFMWLLVEDQGDTLRVQFGPLPIFGTRLRYAEITSVRRVRSRWLDGWGVHFVPGHGWIFNLWGWDCVEIERGRSKTRIGTDDPEGLLMWLRERMVAAGPTRR